MSARTPPDPRPAGNPVSAPWRHEPGSLSPGMAEVVLRGAVAIRAAERWAAPGPGCRKPPEGSHALPRGPRIRWRDRLAVFVCCRRVRRPASDPFSLLPARSAGKPAPSSEPISVATSDPATVSLQAEPPSASLPEFEASLAPARLSGICDRHSRAPDHSLTAPPQPVNSFGTDSEM